MPWLTWCKCRADSGGQRSAAQRSVCRVLLYDVSRHVHVCARALRLLVGQLRRKQRSRRASVDKRETEDGGGLHQDRLVVSRVCFGSLSLSLSLFLYSLEVVLLLGKVQFGRARGDHVVCGRIEVAAGSSACCELRRSSSVTLFLCHRCDKPVSRTPLEHDEIANAVAAWRTSADCASLGTVLVQSHDLIDAHGSCRERLWRL